MGLWKPFSSVCSADFHFTRYDDKASYVPDKNPNPKRFKILQSERIGRFDILLIEYPDCTNFEGKKILVFENIPIEHLRKQTEIDPHFCDSNKHVSPVARFVPTSKGWQFARMFCRHA